MKPCTQNKTRLTWLALNALDAESASTLRAHLDKCPGCRQYWQEVTAVCREHTAASEILPVAVVNESFHRRLKQRIHREETRPRFLSILDAFWRWAVAQTVPLTTLAAVTAIVVALVWMNNRPAMLPARGAIAMRPPPSRIASLQPTLSRYRVVASTSLDALDELLNRESGQNSSAGTALPLFALRQAEIED